MTIQTRPSLLNRLKDLDDQRSWREFFDIYWRLIYRVALKAGLTNAEAQDVVQDTVIAVAKKMPGFEYIPGRDSFKGWLLQITRWKITDQFRKRLPVSEPSARLGDSGSQTTGIDRIPDLSGSLDEVWDEEWRKAILKAAVQRVKRQVNPQHYEIFKQHVLREQPVAQVAQALGVSEGQVYLVKHRITALLKTELKRLENQPL